MRPPLPRLHAVTDERVARRVDLAALAGELARGAGADLAFHARGHTLSGLEHWELADRLSAYAPARLFVNDRADIALAVGAQGVQLRLDGLPPGDARRLEPRWWIGVSVHDLDQAHAARSAGADYLLVGPAFATATHPDRAPLGVEGLADIVRLELPVIAIGGVTRERITELTAAGVYGVAAIRALWETADPAATARHMVQELERA